MAGKQSKHLAVRDTEGVAYTVNVTPVGDKDHLACYRRKDVNPAALALLLVGAASALEGLDPVVVSRLRALLDLLPWYIPRSLGGLAEENARPISSLIDPEYDFPF